MKYGLIPAVVGIGIACAGAHGAMGDELSRLLEANHGDSLGRSIAVEGDIAVIGAPYNDVGSNSSAGSVFIFDISNPSSPVEESEITASDGNAGEWFGWDVAISGDYIVVSSRRDNDNGTDSGSAYIFDISDPANPTEESKITASDAAAGDEFGYSVSMDGDLVIVGAPEDDDDGTSSGSAYLFDISTPSSPTQESKITASDGGTNDQFGRAVEIEGNTVSIGATSGEELASNSGSVYIYDVTTSSTPSEESEITASDAASGDEFGISVDLDGDHLIVGAAGDDDDGSRSGSAYIFDISSLSSPSELSKLTASDGDAGDGFGWSCAILGDIVLVGAWADDDTGNGTGSAYIFDSWDPAGPLEAEKVRASSGSSTGNFGMYSALGDGVALVGSNAAAFLFSEAVCDGDVNYDGVVDVNDIAYVQFRLGTSGPAGDANRDGSVNINDITYVLFRFGAC